ncbi:MAG: RNA 2',3'-cyclic phosphodiesterase [Pseudomonadota bacterium]|nr:RNA 2',3'-cyclic phosphodiesterase [Pseudomonadota bacterium]
MHRLFVAIRPPEEIRDLIVDAMDDSPALRWVPHDNLHLTLRFIGEVERPMANDVTAALAGVRFESFDAALTGVSRFDRRGGGALWAGMAPKELVTALAAKLERACQQAGLEAERRAFTPHVTIAHYGRESRPEAEQFERREAGFQSPPFLIDRFTLFESRLSRHGAYYETVAEFPLT